MKKILSCVLSLFLVVGILAAPVKTEAASVPANANLLNTYGNVIDYVGNALVYSEIMDNNTLSYAAKEYNSITVGNEMKPDYILGWSCNAISVAQAKALGYYIPENYTESTVPKLDFTNVDRMMEACYNKGLKMRGHTLLWHAQTPDWYFRQGYNKNAPYVSQSVMDARMEFFIKTYVGHVCQSKYGEILYAWDVVNEYLHAGDRAGWQKIYGANLGPRAEFIRRAFQYAYDTLAYFNMTDKVHLFYNDFNTYMEVDDVIALVNYVNAGGKKICAGVGMQSHLGTEFPSVAYYKNALSSFCKQGFEVQITELDVGNTNQDTQARYYYDLMRAILDVKKSGGNITALVWWGMTDDHSWRDDNPLLYSTFNVKKPSYNAVLQAYFDAGFTMEGNEIPVVTPTPTPAGGDVANIKDGWYYIKNTGSQKYLQVANNDGRATANVEISSRSGKDGQKWKLTNRSDGYFTLTSALGNFMLDISGGEDKDGANVQIYDGYAGNAQQFIAKETATKGVYTIGTKASDASKMLDVEGGKTADGTNVCQWRYNGDPNQQWVFEAVEETQVTASPSVEPTTQPTEEPTVEPTVPVTGLPSGVTATYKIVSDWGGSFQGEIVLKNSSSKTYNGWTLNFDYNSKITNLWGAELVGQTGNKVTVKNPSWEQNFGPGASVTINFIATAGSDKNEPTNYSFQ